MSTKHYITILLVFSYFVYNIRIAIKNLKINRRAKNSSRVTNGIKFITDILTAFFTSWDITHWF